MSLFGILNIRKPTGRTSRAAVDCIQRLAPGVKAGHAGTLDPLATGVLVICVGRATRLIQYIQQMPKSYRTTFRLGCRSDTDDIEGQVLPLEKAPRPSPAMVDRVLPQFVGDIQQRPPTHSAVKIAGRRAYALARRGEAVELAPRTVTIHRLAVRRYEYPDLELEIECGSGTYVRALGRDIGAELGTAAVTTALERTAIGPFRVEDSVAPTELTVQSLQQHLQPALAAVPDLPQVEVTDAQFTELRHGRPIARPASAHGSLKTIPAEWAAVDGSGRLLAILREKGDAELWPSMNLT
jgi:tRNA pseudouridine55 synthase